MKIEELRNTVCRACPARVVWVKTDKGAKMPLDPEPVANGNVVPTALVDDGMLVVRVLSKAEAEERQGEPRWLSHFVTCPNVDDFRR